MPIQKIKLISEKFFLCSISRFGIFKHLCDCFPVTMTIVDCLKNTLIRVVV